jgi:hypothetical protein
VTGSLDRPPAGYFFQSESGLPLLQTNILRDSLHDLVIEGFPLPLAIQDRTSRKDGCSLGAREGVDRPCGQVGD